MATQQDRIESKLDKVLKQQGDMTTEIALINQRCVTHKDLLSALDEDVNGNGKAGLKQRVHDHDKAFERMGEVGKFSRPIVQRLITAALIAVLAGAWTIYQDHRLNKLTRTITVQVDPNTP